ncbi:MAG: hypothetical protein NTX69_06410 [Candidatus Bipolaricaulota bacterium]|nr:hypothetical protein [Candidatus Bipolaricaulota bacterium]
MGRELHHPAQPAASVRRHPHGMALLRLGNAASYSSISMRAYDKAPPSLLGEPVRSASGGLGPCHLGALVVGDRRAHRSLPLPDHPGAVQGIRSDRLDVGNRAWTGGLFFHVVSTDYYMTLQLDTGKRREPR